MATVTERLVSIL